MNEVIRESYPVARKAHECNACHWLRNYGIPDGEFTISELRIIVKARRNGWAIQPGERHLLQVQKFDGRLVNIRCIPAIDEICQKYDLYPEW